MDLGSYYPRVIELQQQERYQDALKVLEEGIANKDGMSAWYLGYLYNHGIWVKKDSVKSRELYKLSSELGCERGLVNIKLSYKEAIEKNDPFLFFQYYCHSLKRNDNRIAALSKSANLGFSIAQFAYAMDHQNDNNHKIYWLRKAAEQGYDIAINNLGCTFFRLGSFVASYYWYSRTMFYFHRHKEFRVIINCRSSMFTLLAIRRFRQSVLSIFPKDIVVMIAKILWTTNQEECWDSEERGNKKIKMVLN